MSVHRSIVSALLPSFGASLLLGACSGKVLSLGTDTPSQQVAPSEVSGALTACEPNAAHPSVCCTAGPDDEASCFTYPGAPFTPCTSGTTTYPDPRSCCLLDGSGQCTSTSAGASSSGGATAGSSGTGSSSSGGASGGGSSSGIISGGGSSTGGVATCANPCPPGWYPPPDVTVGFECCTSNNGGQGCFGGGSSSSGSGSPGSPPSSSCPACPPGWQVPEGEPNLCCETEATGVIQCFSQAGVPAPTSVEVDAGVAVACSGTGGPDGGPGPCGCQEQVAGHSYAVSCDPNANLCTCKVDDGTPTAGATFPPNGCADEPALFAACGFPH